MKPTGLPLGTTGNCHAFCSTYCTEGCEGNKSIRRAIEAQLPPTWRAPLPPKHLRTAKQECWAAMRDVQTISWAAQKAGLKP